MKIALFGRDFSESYFNPVCTLLNRLSANGTQFLVHNTFYPILEKCYRFPSPVKLFANNTELDPDTFCMISIGGDGTLLDTIGLIRDSGIPILGINTGRLGFLSAISTSEVEIAAQSLMAHDYTIDERTLIQLESPEGLFGSFSCALNELTIQKRDTASMISIAAEVNGLYLNTYWADGLIVATPTGSTGYSLSCGGPIISPDSQNFIITPIATHNLTVRPIVIPDTSRVTLRPSGRHTEYLVVLDSRVRSLNEQAELVIKKAPFTAKLLYPGTMDFFKTIRNKLAWGLDKRN